MGKKQGSAVALKTDVVEHFEKFDHSRFYNCGKKQLTENPMYCDIRGGRANGDVNDISSIIVQLILYITHKFHISSGNSFLWHALIENVIIGNLLTESSTFDASLNFFDINTKQETLSRDLCLFVMSRMRTLAFEEEINFRFMPSNCYVIYFWLLFQSIHQIDYYL